MVELRPAHRLVVGFRAHRRRDPTAAGLPVDRLVRRSDEQAAAAAGFRVIDYLAWGHALYCDDLGDAARAPRPGHAGLLMDWMIDEAKRLGCGEFHLDSGVGPDRTTAHRLYFNKGMRISSHHFSRPV